MRIDLDGLKVGQQFEVLSMILDTKEKEYRDIQIKSLNHIKSNHNNAYQVSGVDPYLILSLPGELQGYGGNVDLLASIVVHKALGAVKELLIKNKEWQFFYSQSRVFKESQSQSLSLSYVSEKLLKADLPIKYTEKSNYIRVDLPSFDGLKIKSISILVNGVIAVGAGEINAMHAIIKNKEGYMINGNDPYIVYELSDEEVINKISVRVEL